MLVPKKSAIIPREVDVSTKFSRNIEINIPLVSAAMDTVTESRLAIAIAREEKIWGQVLQYNKGYAILAT